MSEKLVAMTFEEASRWIASQERRIEALEAALREARPAIEHWGSHDLYDRVYALLNPTPLETPVESVTHASTCPVSRPGFVLIEGLQQCNCDFGKRLAETLGMPFTSDRGAAK